MPNVVKHVLKKNGRIQKGSKAKCIYFQIHSNKSYEIKHQNDNCNRIAQNHQRKN